MEKYPKQLERLDNAKQVYYLPNNYIVYVTGVVIGRMTIKLKVKRKNKIYTVENHKLFKGKETVLNSKRDAKKIFEVISEWKKED